MMKKLFDNLLLYKQIQDVLHEDPIEFEDN
jgi:hypothetical protein